MVINCYCMQWSKEDGATIEQCILSFILQEHWSEKGLKQSWINLAVLQRFPSEALTLYEIKNFLG